MSRGRPIDAVRKAKDQLLAEIGDADWCTGVGIAPVPGGGFALRVNVDPARRGDAKLPTTFSGFAVEVVEIGRYRARDEPGRGDAS